ncbi:hypothetical protein C0992_004755 [Termitomyces sp. T32_za158]|nr:hypothetical protein C0992_004755 [Termitomyces sp. T32_za158]
MIKIESTTKRKPPRSAVEESTCDLANDTKVNDTKTTAHLELIQDYNRLRDAFRAGEEEREEMSTEILLLKERIHQLHSQLIRSRQFCSLIGKQLVMHGKLHQPGDFSDGEEE